MLDSSMPSGDPLPPLSVDREYTGDPVSGLTAGLQVEAMPRNAFVFQIVRSDLPDGHRSAVAVALRLPAVIRL
jgi:hypothetical protein